MNTKTLNYNTWARAGCLDQVIDKQNARAIIDGAGVDLMALLAAAGNVRKHYFDNTVSIHVLDNVQNGACSEDCGYCGQSKESDAPIKPYKIKTVDQIVADAKEAKQSGAFRFCMAMSGRGPDEGDIKHICQAITQIKAMGLRTCLSAGLMDRDKALLLKEAGLDRMNHNLNTSQDHYKSICSTHTYQDRMATLSAARAAGLGICSGMIVGMGETYDDLIEVAYELRKLKVESIPVNFLLPIEGNEVHEPTCEGHALDPQFVLRVLCMVRFVNPSAEIRIAAGREYHLRSLQPLSLWPANSLFMQGYLLSNGQDAIDTVRMIHDAGFVPRLDEGELPDLIRQIINHPKQINTTQSTVPLTVELKSTVRSSP